MKIQEADAKSLLLAQGLPVPPWEVARTAAEARAAAARLLAGGAGQVVIKAQVLVGGRGTLIGPVLGTALFTALPEVLRPAGEVQDAVFGLLLIAILLWMPRGLGPGLARWLRLPAK